ncbi:MAG: tRNA (5-methylaminomethyl-2-thiouridine)(34)-methyltransferase MnmD [Pseudomonadota bacterium]
MPEHHKKPELEWRGAVPIARQFDDPYYSLNGGLDETRHVFLAGNGLPNRFAPGFHIAELGFGTGLNALAAWQMWRDTGQAGALRFTSFELYPIAAIDMARALAVYPELQVFSDALIAGLQDGKFKAPDFELEIIFGDARETLPSWDGQADAWFLDGFSPAKNPELWGPKLLAEVARHTAPGGTAATYSAAGHVRASLAEAGFTVERCPGFGRKKHMTVARK